MIIVIIGLIILFISFILFLISLFLYAKYLYLFHFKADKQYVSFLKWFNSEYKDIIQ